jgi:hypothetical protein
MDNATGPTTDADGEAPAADSPTREFRDDDVGYLAWLATNRGGYVINIARSHSTDAARVHHAACRTISGNNPHGGPWTGPYVKVCAQHMSELAQWMIDETGQQIPPCGICRPRIDVPPIASPKPADPRVTATKSDARWKIRGPVASSPAVEAWAEDYIRFEHLPAWQEQLRNEIRSRCRQLEPSADQVLHATYFGAKHSNADIENLALYNIDSFKVAGRNGIRFEHGAVVPPAPEGFQYGFSYRYALAPRSGTFTDWRPGRTLASFDWIDLGAFSGEKKLALVWMALTRGDVTVSEPAGPETLFAIRLQVRPPLGRQPVWGALVKGLFDGVICGFQAHTDTTVLPDVAARLAKYLLTEPREITERLLDQSRAVLGAVPRLVSPYQAGVKWNPSDHLCVAGQLLAAEPVDAHWALRGEIVEATADTIPGRAGSGFSRPTPEGQIAIRPEVPTDTDS